jgi:DNA polymerase III subunit gamma/tau
VPASASLYRRHRPRTFADVVGQDHVVRTLRNAIEQDKVHHAYLFVGSRGTGKTSMAKILAASLNCERGGPTVSPCGVCDSCRSIASATSLDVIEMDAASNNSVDDIRELRERVAYAPVSGRHKVYILDEAHMLSTAAWNAFLKTLEEPPPHTIFVLATTEAAKVLPTVVDRCHRFDFSRPTVVQIAQVLRRAADAEEISVPDEAVALIARSATGSFRDALGTLEQLLAYSGKEIALDDVLAVLGAADADLVFGAVDAVEAGDRRAALLAAARLADSGRDVGRFFADLEAHVRGLMVVQALGGVPPELRVTAEQDERLAEQARRVGGATVVRLLDLIAAALRAMKDGADARTQLELALLKGAAPAFDPSVRALLSRLERLEARTGNGGSAAPAPPPRDPAAPATPAARAAAPAPPAAPPAPAPQAAPASPPVPAPQAAPRAYGSPPPDGPAVGRTSVSVSAQVEGQPPVAATTTLPGAPAGGAAEAGVMAEQAASAVKAELATEGHPEPAVTAVAVVEPEAPAPEPRVELSLDAFADLWPAVLESLQSDAPMLAALLESARPADLEGEDLTLTWPESAGFLKRKAEDPANKELIAHAIRAVTGNSLRLAYELSRHEHDAAHAPRLSEEELVNRFVKEFDAEVLPHEEEPT